MSEHTIIRDLKLIEKNLLNLCNETSCSNCPIGLKDTDLCDDDGDCVNICDILRNLTYYL